MKAPDLLQAAAGHMAARAATYDRPEGERSMARAVRAFNAKTGRDENGAALTEAEGWLLLQDLKDVRLFTRPGYHADSAEDCIAYAALKAEAKAGESPAHAAAEPLPPICRAPAPSCATCRHADRAECPPGCVRLSKWEAA